MDISIRKHIIKTFKNAKVKEIEDSIEDAITSDDEAVLPGLGVFFEIIWKNSNDEEKNRLLNSLLNNMI